MKNNHLKIQCVPHAWNNYDFETLACVAQNNAAKTNCHASCHH
jgi:hypothetical protein